MNRSEQFASNPEKISPPTNFDNEFARLFVEWKDKWVRSSHHRSPTTESSPGYHGPSLINTRVAGYLPLEQLEAERPEMEARASLVDYAASTLAQLGTSQEQTEIIDRLSELLHLRLHGLNERDTTRLLIDIFKAFIAKKGK